MADTGNDLTISRYLAVSRARIWRAWADPKILAEWWCPKPWTTEVRAFDFRPGGDFYTFMRGPPDEGGESDNPGCFLDIVPEERLVFTSLLVGGWRPVTPWIGITAIFTLADEADGTRYDVRVMHRDAEESARHVEMGFHDGWNVCIDQLAAVARRL